VSSCEDVDGFEEKINGSVNDGGDECELVSLFVVNIWTGDVMSDGRFWG
jgi:hypothetical protein